MLSFGFPPVATPAAHGLVLGTLPGRLSLERGEYYANPRNMLWKIIAARIADLPPDYAATALAAYAISAIVTIVHTFKG